MSRYASLSMRTASRLIFALALIPLALATGCSDQRQSAVSSLIPTAPPTTQENATRDPHSFSRPDEVRIEHIALDLTVDFAKKQLVGMANLRIKNLTGAESLVLDSSGLDIRSVTLQPGDIVSHFRLGDPDPILGTSLEIPIHPGTTSVVINYATDPGARALQWLDPAMTAGKQHPFLLSQSQAINARTWVPCQDTPGVRFTYDATLHVPKELLALMSADNPQAKTEDGVYQFRMPQPIPSYLLAIAVGNLEFRPFDSKSGVYAEPEMIEEAAAEFEDTPKMIAAVSDLYGPYRWERYDLLVLPPSFPYGGMENPRLTFLTPTVIAGDKSLVSLIAHELAHSWSGNLVTNATWNDFWLNEGVTTYIEHRLTERLYGREYSEMLWRLGLTDVQEELATLPPADQGLFIDLTGRDPDDAPGIVYEKGAFFFRLLEETAGRERFDAFLRQYFADFAYKPMTTARFEEYLREKLPDVVAKVDIKAWIHGPGMPPNTPQPQSKAFEKVEAAAKKFAEGGSVKSLKMDGWSSHERVHFIQSLPELTPERMGELDKRFHFSDSGNSEVLSAWLEKSIDTGYKGAYPAIERFLTTQGRRKFLKPIYEKLMKTDPEFAKRVYTVARPTYHPVSQGTIDAILKWPAAAPPS